MKLTDNLIHKYGYDKLLHFTVGALITAIFGFIGKYMILIGLLLTIILSVLKEYIFDASINIKDMISGVSGGVFSVIIFYLITIIKTLIL